MNTEHFCKVALMKSLCRQTPVCQLKTGFIEVIHSLHSSSIDCLSGKVIINRKINWVWLQVGIAEADGAQEQKN